MIKTRFAPSPTGYLHIGGLRTALYSYLWAKKNNGQFLLRIEDTDLKRNSKLACDEIIKAFNWVGIENADEVYFQSKRFDIYKEYIQQLLDEDKAYYCYMSKNELEELRETQRQNKQRTKYNRKYRDYEGKIPSDVKPVVRIKAPIDSYIEFNDGIKGNMRLYTEDVLDDFIIARDDGTPTYNFVVAIDDALMGITDVIRGEDHLSNTSKQIVIYNALDFDIPNFFHIPMINNEAGKKLSKRDGAVNVMKYKEAGYLPEALLNFLVRLGWSHGDQELFSMQEMIELFNPNDINKSASAYNTSKLDWINSEYIKSLPENNLLELLKEFDLDLSSNKNKSLILELFKSRVNTLKEFSEEIHKLLNAPNSYNDESIKKHINEDSIKVLKSFIEFFNIERPNTLEDYETKFKEFLKTNDLKMGKVAPALRILLLGDHNSPSISSVLYILGTDEIIKRSEKFFTFMEN
ncbi:MAG: Glutamyl-tRNA synthetase (EC [uncultured Campylobacterales bacterium]|uniref:Glutamate--tRNA ligase n=1 Tax=uncultured Campylobacterales bacterium TaxID=352960 RepID=A0A6S6T3K9_9BACT|nr:MAG: Glutamyl-tRNA synthetase (EC [uncultured Campylobacterales bacterium]